MYKFLYDKQNRIIILNDSSAYPHKNNCYKLVVIGKDGTKVTYDFVPKPETDLAMSLRKLLTQKELDLVYPLLSELYQEGYDHAADNAAEEAAGVDY